MSTTVPSPAGGIAGHLRAVLSLGLPLVGSHVAQFAITLTDAVMLGRYDVTVLAGQVLGSQLFFVTFIVGSGFAWAVMPMVARARGAGDEVRIRRVTRMSLWICAGYGLLFLPLMLAGRHVFEALGQDPALSALGGEYLAIQGVSILPGLMVMVLKSYLAALERTRVVLWVTLGAVALNVGANWLLIFGNAGFPELGIRGAAWASLLVTTASMAAMVVYSVRLFPEHALFRRQIGRASCRERVS